jgi:hypothetical protein
MEKTTLDELYDLYCTPNIVQVIISRRLVGHVARMGERRDAYRVLVERTERVTTWKTQA